MGHALNKVLKDIICRFKIMQGYNVRYVYCNGRSSEFHFFLAIFCPPLPFLDWHPSVKLTNDDLVVRLLH